MRKDLKSTRKYLKECFQAPRETHDLYNRLWQLETWLREMVYIELRSFEKEWKRFLPKKKNNDPLQKDKRLTPHMSTLQENPLAYLTFGELWDIIRRGDRWNCFSAYFPPKDILEARLKELSQIRHRVAHFRIPHCDDLDRLEQFLRDTDQGFWKFCTSYNDRWALNVENEALRDSFPMTSQILLEKEIRLDLEPLLQVLHSQHADLYLTFYRSIRPWAEPHINPERLENFSVSEPGILYHAVTIAVGQIAMMQYREILRNTKSFHENCIHIILEWLCRSITLTFPSILPLEVIGDTLEKFLKETHKATLRLETLNIDEMEAEQVAAEWPEYVLPPSNPFSFLCSDMPCSFFGVE